MPVVNGFRTTKEDYDRIKEFSDRSGRSLTDIFRTAVLKYIDESQQTEDDQYFARRMRERDKIIVEALKSVENRFAILLVRLGIDMESMYALAWSLTEGQPDRKEVFEQCYEVGLKRFRRKLKGLERQMVDSLIHQEEQLAPAILKELEDKKQV